MTIVDNIIDGSKKSKWTKSDSSSTLCLLVRVVPHESSSQFYRRRGSSDERDVRFFQSISRAVAVFYGAFYIPFSRQVEEDGEGTEFSSVC